MFRPSSTYNIAILMFVLFGASLLRSPLKESKLQVVKRHSIRTTDTLPVVKLPPGADLESPDWKGIDLAPKAPILPVSPSDEQKRFLLPPGYKIEPILTEPAIEQPAAIAFDGNGHMYVLELRSYMLDADSKNELDPVSRISRWEDKDNDGVYETGTTFVDSLVFPRFVLPYGKDCILSMESDADNVYKYTDTNGDGKADKKEFFTSKYGRSGNVEHQQAFMYYGMDNWLYSTVNAFRIRETPQGIIREKTGANRAQWGVAHDDDGKLWFQGGASGLPSHFQFPVHYGNFEIPNEFAKGFDIPWGAAVKTSDMQGGMDEIRQPDGSLNRVTGSAGNDVYRGDRLPANIKGQYFYGEPVARIVRQINPVVTEGLTTLHNVFQEQKSEFLRSTDPLFRPVDMTTAPDGTMYITDMYRGIIQEGQWTQRGSYLRVKIEQYQLDKVIGLGRIWRVTYDGIDRDKTKPRMFEESSAQLVKHLEHPNGWWRDMAQQLLVLRKDQSVVPQLNRMALKHKSLTTRFHAIWTLEGLGALSVKTTQKLLKDTNPRLRIQALRASETLYKNGDKTLEPDYQRLLTDPDTDVLIQAMLTAKFLKLPNLEQGIKGAMAQNKASGVKVIGEQILNPPKPRNAGPFGAPELTEVQKLIVERGTTIYNELCAQCHGNTGMGTPAGEGKLMAPALAGSARMQGHPEYAIKVVLHGMDGAIEGKTYAGNMMASMKDQSDQWVADVVSYIRSELSNDASFVSLEQVAAVRKKTSGQSAMYKFDDLLRQTPYELTAKDMKATASHVFSTRIGGNASAQSAFNYEGWSTGGRQDKGMWFQVEFPQEVKLAEIHFTATQITKPGWRPTPNTPPASRPILSTHPRVYSLEISMDGKNWQTAAANVKGVPGANILTLNAARAKFMRISLAEGLAAGDDDTPWSVRQMKVFVEK